MNPYRLPRTAVPLRYDLRLEPDLKSAVFSGEVVATVSIKEPTREIVLNALELSVDSAVAELTTGREVAEIRLDPKTERCHLLFPGAIPVGECRVRLTFRGTLNDKLRGFYRSRYQSAAGDRRYLAATHFEATDARRAFPCWDEPDLKAVFSSTLVVDPELTVISNTQVAEERHQDGKRVVRFADTIRMSTYLVAFAVGEFEATEPVFVGETPLRVWCVPGKRRLAGVAREIGAFSLHWFENYYGRKYPGDKLDLIGIPDFAAGAMENLGAITFRETALLVDPAATTHDELERVADVVAHENAHMWFGDLVTMSWWNGLWLNEAFATFMELLAVDAWKPEWKRWTTFGISRSEALLVDGLASTRPIEYPVEAPRDADAMFDVLTYQKGASVLRMLEQFIGPKVFQEGVRIYLQRHAYGNTETGDLWTALGEASRQPIPDIMNGWIFSSGYPLLRARREGNELVISQNRFSYLPQPESSAQLWQVPVALRWFTSSGDEVTRLLLGARETRVRLPEGFKGVFLNAGGHGFYRGQYSAELLKGLLDFGADAAAEVNRAALDGIERLILVNDSWAATQAGLMSLTDYLDLTAHFRNESDKNVWTLLLGSFNTLNRIVAEESRPQLARLVCDRLTPTIERLGWQVKDGESELTRQLRGDLIEALGTLGADPQARKWAAETEAREARQPGTVDSNLLAAAIAIVARTGDEVLYQQFLDRFRKSRTPQEEQRFLYALTGFAPRSLVEQTLQRCLDGEIRTQDAPFVVRSLLVSVHGRQLAWQFIQANWDAMNQKFPPAGVRRMCEGLVGLASPQWEREVRAFFKRVPPAFAGKTLDQYLEKLRIVVSLGEREGAALKKYLG